MMVEWVMGMKEYDRPDAVEFDWLCLNGLHSVFADKQGLACVQKEGYGHYGAVSECSEKAYRDLASLVKPGRMLLVVGKGYLDCPEWQRVAQFPGHGMILETPAKAPELDYVKLTPSDADEIVELAKKAGLSTFPRAVEMGTFYGVKENGKIVSIAGEGMAIDGFTEVSDVRTHPDFRKRGYGGGLIQVISQGIQERGETVILRVRAENTGAIRLYKKLGFKIFYTGNYDVLVRTSV
jgi:ribosomal protein S18 acetylase RimI-like enzyme